MSFERTGPLRGIKESDWRIFRELHKVALERFCRRVLEEVERLNGDSSKSCHERYLAIYRYTREQDKDLAFAFNGMRRSTAVIQLARMQAHNLLTAEELARFSEETRSEVETLLDIQRR
jgi:hypothetical protein